MLVSEFDFTLPAELIAQTAAPRGTSRLLHLAPSGTCEHLEIRRLPELLRPEDVLVVNNTRVIPARIYGRLPTGGRVELLLVEPLANHEWNCLVKPGRKLRPGTTVHFSTGLAATVQYREAGLHRMEFSEAPEPHLQRLGHVPLPPYIKRNDRPEDRERYQTVYAAKPGAIAAPTAGLHFDEALLAAIRERGVTIAELTLHVGIGTFKPVTATLAHEHQMEPERFEIDASCAAAIESARRRGGRLVAVGTTVVRALEYAAAIGDGDGDDGGEIPPQRGAANLFIRPGYRFRAVDLLLTNFHLPRSTLLMLVSAFAGTDRVLAAYHSAVEQRYRFYSYGDAMLLHRHINGGGS